MKAVYKIAAGLAVAGFAVSAAIAARPIPKKVAMSAEGPSGGIAAAGTPWTYSTGFEAGEGFPTGYISNTPGTFPAGCDNTGDNDCWMHTTAANASLITPTIESVNPATGTQHLRLTFDLTTRTNVTGFGLGVDARYPGNAFIAARPDAANTMTVDIAIDQPQGQDFVVQPQSISMGSSMTITLFHYSGAIYIVDDTCESIGAAYLPTGAFWDTTGGYKPYMIEQNPCENTAVHSYDGAVIMDTCIWNGTRLEQFLIYGDNYPGSTADVDNVFMTTDDICPSVCGNNILEAPAEQCDGAGQDANCPGRCTQDCLCAPICTLAEPCPIENGINPPVVSSGGFYVYTGGSPFISVNGCGSNYDAAIQVQTVADPGTPIAFNDDCNAGPYGDGSDTSASCYDGASGNEYGSCTCFANPNEPVLVWAPRFTGAAPPLGSVSVIEVRKKSVCAGESVGACCDTNGQDTGCLDNVTSANCTGADKVWTDQGKCADQVCSCIPDCTGATCGDDGCGGSCGTCGDGNVCNGEETCVDRNCAAGTPLVCNDGNACNGVETCDPIAGCRPGTPLPCDDGAFCNGEETCNPSSGCVPGTNPCPENTTCNEDTDACDPNSIPTVSEWGLVVLTLMLLIGAKVYFGRRQAIA